MNTRDAELTCGGPLSLEERARLRRATCDIRLATPGAPNCTRCACASDLKGDPRRGYCLERRHMVGAGTVCGLFIPRS